MFSPFGLSPNRTIRCSLSDSPWWLRLHAERNTLGRPGDLGQLGKRGCNADGPVFGVAPVRMCGSGGRQFDARFLGEGHNAARAAGRYVEADEVPAFGPG